MTTDEMDKTGPGERYKLVCQCMLCGEWTHFTGDRERLLQSSGVICDHCGGQKFDPRTTHTERTFNAETAHKKTLAVKKKLKR